MKEYVKGNKSDMDGFPLTDNIAKFIDSLPQELDFVINKIASKAGVWIVGGAIRDAALGIYPDDIDLATDLPPKEIMKIFPNGIPTGISFGTISIKSGGYLFQTTTLRTDGDYLDNRRPESVTWGTSLKEDLDRRDFTINSMAIDVARRILYDPHNGMADLHNQIIRCVGLPSKRISEDGLRILRAFRFLGHRGNAIWELENNLNRAIERNSFMLDDLARERIWQELRKILRSNVGAEIIEKMISSSILDRIIQIKIENKLSLQKALVTSKDLDYISLFALIMNGQEMKSVKECCRKMKMSNKEIKQISSMHSLIGYAPKNEIGELRLYRYILGEKWYQQLLLERYMRNFALIDFNDGKEDSYFVDLIESIQKLKPLHHNKELADGNWIMNTTNIKQGQRLGRLKEWLFRLQIEKDLEDLSQIEALLCKIHWKDVSIDSWPRISIL